MKNVGDTREFGDKELRCISLCSGYRGLEKGLQLAGVKHRTECYVEIEAFCIANLVAAMEKGAIRPAPIWTNLKTFVSSGLQGKVDIITGGYPCQPFSAAGNREGEEDPRHLWPYISKIVDAIRPVYCFFENVEGHVTLGYDKVYRSLSDMGYQVESGIFSSAEAGGSHQRKRLFILARLQGGMGNPCNNRTCGGIRYERKRQKDTEKRNDGTTGIEFGKAGGNVVNPNSDDDSNHTFEISGKEEAYEGKTQWEKWNYIFREWGRPKFSTAGSEFEAMANTIRNGEGKICFESNTTEFDRFSRIPIMPPCIYQYEWEEPRQNTKDVLKSRLGLSVANGYDFRTDFLRALGNGVDPFAAAIAFRTLIKKFE